MDFFMVLAVLALILPAVAVVCFILGLLEWSYNPRFRRIKQRWWATAPMAKLILTVFVVTATLLLMFSAADTFRAEEITDPNDGLPVEIILIPYCALAYGYGYVCIQIHKAACGLSKARAMAKKPVTKKTTTKIFNLRVEDQPQPPTEKELKVPDWVKIMQGGRR